MRLLDAFGQATFRRRGLSRDALEPLKVGRIVSDQLQVGRSEALNSGRPVSRNSYPGMIGILDSRLFWRLDIANARMPQIRCTQHRK